MFKSVLFLHTFILVLVTSNPLQGFVSYPVIQYKGNYKNSDQPILVQPSDFNSYNQQQLTQNQITPYQNTISYNDYMQLIYLQQILQNQGMSSIDSNGDQNPIKIRQYVQNPADNLLVNNYFWIPSENDVNQIIDIDGKALQRKSRVDENDLNTNNKHTSRKNTEENTNENDNDEMFTSNKTINKNVKNQSNKKDVRKSKNKKSKNKKQRPSKPKEIENSALNEKQSTSKNTDSKKDTDRKKSNKARKGSKSITGKDEIPNKGKKRKSENRTNTHETAIINDDSHNFEICDCLDINENCAAVGNRCTRNYDSENLEKYQQPISLSPNDYSNNIASYINSIMSNQQFNTNSFYSNGNYPYNLDYFYNMLYSNLNSNGPQKKQKKTRKSSKRKKQKKLSKTNSDQNEIKETASDACDKIVELSPNILEVTTTDAQPPSSTLCTTLGDGTSELDHSKEIIELTEHSKEMFELTENSKEIIELTEHSKEIIEHEDNVPFKTENDIIDEYYPDFQSDNIYLSKEDYDWNNFHDRHYYSSSDKSEPSRERREYERTNKNDIHETGYFKGSNSIENDQIFKELNEDSKENNIMGQNDNEIKSSIEDEEDIKFKTPPGLDYPDFKTEMIDKDKYISSSEILYYQPSNKVDNKYENNKMSSYSHVKTGGSNDKTNKMVDRIDVETVLGHSKVIKYGASPKNDEEENYFTKDGETTVIIAKSSPHPV